MPILGAHQSIAGGYYRCVEIAEEQGCDCVQLFTKNNNQWRAKEIVDADIEKFQSALAASNVQYPLSHNSYLINLGSPKDELWEKSIDAMVIELQRAEMLGVPNVVAHPGSFTTSTPAEGIRRIAAGIDAVHAELPDCESRILLETTAGQGSNLGWQFEQIGEIIELAADADRLGVCFDTCHVFAAGYPLGDPEEYAETMRRFDETIGTERIKAFHLNDSKGDLGSRKDRHEKIGEGFLGIEPFRNLMNDKRFAEVPMYLETPKGEEDGESLDRINLQTLRNLVR